MTSGIVKWFSIIKGDDCFTVMWKNSEKFEIVQGLKKKTKKIIRFYYENIRYHSLSIEKALERNP